MSISLILIILLIAGVIFFYTKKESDLKEDSQHWSSVEGAVSSSHVRRTFLKKNGTSETNFLFELQYNYEVQGQIYTGNRYQFYADPSFKSKADAEQLVAEYPAGKKITIYYLPDDPQQAVVKR